MNFTIQRQRRIVTLLRWVMFIALAFLITSDGASSVQLMLLAVVVASNVALSRVPDRLWEHQALLPVIAGLDTAVLVAAMLMGQGFAREFFFAYFAHLAVVALAGNLRAAIVGSGLVVAGYGTIMALEHGVALLQTPALLGRLGFLFTMGVGYGGLLEASRTRIREAALQDQLTGWVGKLSAAFSDDFDAVEVIRKVLVDTQTAFPGNSRASLVQIEGERLRVIGCSEDTTDGDFELVPERYPELVAATRTEEPIIIDDIRSDPLMKPVRELVSDLPFTALLLCPVKLADSEFGHVVLRIGRRGPGFSPRMVATAQQVAEGIAVIFRQAKMREAMERSERMEMVSQVTRSVAHSFDDILSTVLVSSEALRKGARRHDEHGACSFAMAAGDAAARFGALENATREGLTIVERLGAWTRLGSHAEERTSTGIVASRTLLEEAWHYAGPVWSKRSQTRDLDVEWDCDSVLPVIGTGPEVREVILALILNAIDAMPKGGKLTLGLHPEGDQVVFAVSDTGVGIPDKLQDRVFEPFFSTKGAAGAGLGLPLARSVAERHGGSLRLTSIEGRGSTFELRLPAAPADRIASEPLSAGSVDAAAESRVLLVDPSHLVRDVMVRALQGFGFDVDVVADLDEAEVMLAARSGYAGVVADAAAGRALLDGFLGRLTATQPGFGSRVVLYATGDLPQQMLDLQAAYGFGYFDRGDGLAALRHALATLGSTRSAA